MADSTHTIRFQNRGIAFLVGLVAIYVLVRLFWSGWIFNAGLFATSPAPPSSDGLGYGAGLILGLAVEVVVGVGGGVIFLVSGLWDLIVSELRAWRARSEAKALATVAATEAASVMAGASAGISAASSAMVSDTPTGMPMERANRNALKNHESRLREVEAKTRDMELPPPPKTPEEIVAEQAEALAAMKATIEELKSKPSNEPAAKVTTRRRTTKAGTK